MEQKLQHRIFLERCLPSCNLMVNVEEDAVFAHSVFHPLLIDRFSDPQFISLVILLPL